MEKTIIKITSENGRVNSKSFWNTEVDNLSDDAIMSLIPWLSDTIKQVNDMLALRLRDKSQHHIEKIDCKNPNMELINKNFKILIDKNTVLEKELKKLQKEQENG